MIVPNNRVADESQRLTTPSLEHPLLCVDLLHQGIEALLAPSQLTEVRILGGMRDADNRPCTFSGYFRREDSALIETELRRFHAWHGAYLVPNEIHPDAHARCPGRLDRCDGRDITTDDLIVCRRWLLIDVDAVRVPGISASDEEHAAALARVRAIADYLQEHGLPPGIIADSGNGGHLMIPASLPNDAPSNAWHKALLQRLAAIFDDAAAQVDGRTFNASRIWKAPGTAACKGDSTAERPWRVARILEDRREPGRCVSGDDLAAIAESLGFAEALQEQERQGQRRRGRPRKTQAASGDALERCRAYVATLPPAIQGQDGSGRAFRAACAIYRFGLSDDDARMVFGEYNERCEPPWSEQEIAHKLADARRAVEEAGEFGNMADESGKQSQATSVVRMIEAAGVELFHDPSGDGYARWPVGDHYEVARLTSKSFSQFVLLRHYLEVGGVLSGKAKSDAIATLAALAADGPEYPVHLRVAEHDGRCYIDLADGDRNIVEVDASGWRLIRDAPVMFRRTDGIQPLPIPERGGSVGDLREFLEPIDDASFALVVAWLLCALHPGMAYPVLQISAEAGSGKTTKARMLRSLVDPRVKREQSGRSKSLQDLMVQARSEHVVALDNLSELPEWLSDGLCCLATGAAYSARRLYTDDEEHVVVAQRPVMLTAIEEVAVRGDLLDRVLAVALPPLVERKSENALWADFNAVRPRIFGALLDAMSHALRRLPDLQVDNLPRLAGPRQPSLRSAGLTARSWRRCRRIAKQAISSQWKGRSSRGRCCSCSGSNCMGGKGRPAISSCSWSIESHPTRSAGGETCPRTGRRARRRSRGSCSGLPRTCEGRGGTSTGGGPGGQAGKS